MADALSQGSLDSAGDEFVVVNAEPRLKIANNGDMRELETKMSEVLSDNVDKGESPVKSEAGENEGAAVGNSVEKREKVNPFNKKKGTEDVATVGVDDDVNTESGKEQ